MIYAAAKTTARAAARVRRCFTLVELALTVAGIVAIIGLVFVAAADGIYLMRLAAQHEDRAGVVASLGRALRRDLLTAAGATWDGATLTLELPAAPGGAAEVSAAPGDPPPAHPVTIRYEFASDRVVRSMDGLVSHEWRAERLTFAAQHASGPRADLLTIEFGEAPPPRAAALPHRAARTAFVLPRAPAAPRPEAGEGRP